MNDEQIIDDLIRREGSAYTEHPHDRGGATKYGVTQRSWEAYRRKAPPHRAIIVHVRDLDESDARDFYLEMHVKPMRWIGDSRLRGLVVDCGVNHGPSRAVKWMQKAAGVEVDGRVGPKTRAAVNLQPIKVFYTTLALRLKFYAAIVAADETQRVFLRGWINRACEFLE